MCPKHFLCFVSEHRARACFKWCENGSPGCRILDGSSTPVFARLGSVSHKGLDHDCAGMLVPLWRVAQESLWMMQRCLLCRRSRCLPPELTVTMTHRFEFVSKSKQSTKSKSGLRTLYHPPDFSMAATEVIPVDSGNGSKVKSSEDLSSIPSRNSSQLHAIWCSLADLLRHLHSQAIPDPTCI